MSESDKDDKEEDDDDEDKEIDGEEQQLLCGEIAGEPCDVDGSNDEDDAVVETFGGICDVDGTNEEDKDGISFVIDNDDNDAVVEI